MLHDQAQGHRDESNRDGRSETSLASPPSVWGAAIDDQDDRSSSIWRSGNRPIAVPGESTAMGSQPDWRAQVTQPWGAGDHLQELLSDSDELVAVIQEFESRWDQGHQPRAEDYQDRLARSAPGEFVRLIYHEYRLAESSGLDPEPEDYYARFPEHRDRLNRLLTLHSALGPESPTPEQTLREIRPGAEIGPYRIVQELGAGAFARVFLAEQCDLENRRVVLKLATRISTEPDLLARAQHPHIVEIYRHDMLEGIDLHLIVMPFRGGATLADVLENYHRLPPRLAWSTGSAWKEALTRAESKRKVPPVVRLPESELDRDEPELTWDFPGVLDHDDPTRVAAGMMARLAEALHYARTRGIVHGDLKPSNILITSDGRPMLLDFNLGQDDNALADPEQARRGGGTLMYLAPERLEALLDPHDRPTTLDQLHAADIYSFGLVLLETLGGRPLTAPVFPNGADLGAIALRLREHRREGPERLDRRIRRLPIGVQPIIRRCLDDDPRRRYLSAAEIARDLFLWVDGRPLQHTSDSSWLALPSRIWSRKATLVPTALAVVLVLSSGIGLFAYSRQQELRRVEALEYRDRVEAPYLFRFPSQLLDPLHQTRLVRASSILDGYNVRGPRDWRDVPGFHAMGSTEQDDIELLIYEQVYRAATLLVEGYSKISPDQRRQARSGLAHCLKLRRLEPLERLANELEIELPPAEFVPKAPDWMMAYLDGVSAEANDLERAVRAYKHALTLHPQLFWPRYRLACVEVRRGHFASASNHLQECVAQRPEHRRLWIALAGCLAWADEHDAALEAIDRAISMDRSDRAAWLCKALIAIKNGNITTFQSSYEQYEAWMDIEFNRGVHIEVLVGQFDNGRLDESDFLDEIIRFWPTDEQTVNILLIALHKQGKHQKAINLADHLLNQNPDMLFARFTRAITLATLGQSEHAIEEFRIISNHSQYSEFVGVYPMAIRAELKIVNNDLENGLVEKALQHAQRARELSNKNNLHNRSKVFAAEAEYGLFRCYASMADHNLHYRNLASEQIISAIKLHSNIRHAISKDTHLSKEMRKFFFDKSYSEKL